MTKKVKETIEQMVAALERTDLWLKARCDGIGLVGDEIEALKAGRALLEHLKAQPKRRPSDYEWVCLDSTKMLELWRAVNGDSSGGIERYSRAVEAYLKEKNTIIRNYPEKDN